MAQQNRSTIKTYFETGDVPTQTQFGDSFDSQVFWQDDVEITLGTTDTKVPTSKAVSDAISAASGVQSVTGANVDNTDPLNPVVNVPTLEDVNSSGGQAATNASKYGDVADQLMNVGFNNIEYVDVPNGFNTAVSFEVPTAAGGVLKLPDTAGATKTLATTDQIGSGAVASVTGTCVDNTDPANPVVNALALDGSNANSDVDLGTYALNAKSFKVNGTAGAGHLSLKHQSSGATAAASESVIYADSSGNPQWKNDGNAVEQILTSKNVFDIYITTGDQTTTSNVNTGITGLSVSAEANKRYAFDGFIHVGCNNTGGIKFTVTVPSGATLNFGFDAPATPNTSNGIKQFINASGTQTAALCNANSALGIVEVRGEVTIGATAGTIQFGFASSTSGQTSTAYQNGTNIEVKVRG